MHCKPEPCRAHRELPVSQLPQGKTCFHYREPLFSLQGTCFHYKGFPVNPCTSLLGIAVCFYALLLHFYADPAVKLSNFAFTLQIKKIGSQSLIYCKYRKLHVKNEHREILQFHMHITFTVTVFSFFLRNVHPPTFIFLTLISLINAGPTLTDFEEFHPPQKKIPPPHFFFLRLHKSCLSQSLAVQPAYV